MTSYRAVLKLTRSAPYLWDHRILDSQAVVDSLTDVVAHQVATDQWGRVTLDVTLTRQDHEAALNDLFVLAQQLGYSLLNGEISKLVGLEIETAILGGLGSGALGTTSNNGWIALLAAAAGAVGGWMVGSSLKRVETVYDVRPNPFGGWTFSPRIQPGGQAEPGVAWM